MKKFEKYKNLLIYEFNLRTHMQCAAVIAHRSLRMEAPHLWSFLSPRNEPIKGHSPSSALKPFTILTGAAAGCVPQMPVSRKSEIGKRDNSER